MSQPAQKGRLSIKTLLIVLLKLLELKDLGHSGRDSSPHGQGLVLGNLCSGFHMRNFVRLQGYPRSTLHYLPTN